MNDKQSDHSVGRELRDLSAKIDLIKYATKNGFEKDAIYQWNMARRGLDKITHITIDTHGEEPISENGMRTIGFFRNEVYHAGCLLKQDASEYRKDAVHYAEDSPKRYENSKEDVSSLALA